MNACFKLVISILSFISRNFRMLVGKWRREERLLAIRHPIIARSDWLRRSNWLTPTVNFARVPAYCSVIYGFTEATHCDVYRLTLSVSIGIDKSEWPSGYGRRLQLALTQHSSQGRWFDSALGLFFEVFVSSS